MTGKARLVVLVSGNGSNLQAIIDAISAGVLDAEILLVVSNRRDARGLRRAEDADVPSIYLPFRPGEQTRSEYDAELARTIAPSRPDWIVLAGWMRILGPAFLDRFHGRVLNLHPALPGTFAGVNAIERAFEASRNDAISQTGVMIHHVIPEVDAGPVVASERVPIFPDDTLDSLEARVHETEHRLLVRALIACRRGMQ